ncbi:putative membrane protein [Morelia viridis nidovirus]|uniref:Putative membrane protein n=1 Tax=Morelia viridis nidovirus TaxID=2016400 RepID=A0A222AIF6_9NIDO|nr:putative membrane protein [Morelia viridis nidovirus]ASO76153.1 putative membrane protein [Morelia viridis nidovirus]
MYSFYQINNKIRAHAQAYLPIQDALVVLAVVLAIGLIMDMLVKWMPKIAHLFIFRKLTQILHFVKFLFYLILFFLTDANVQRTNVQKFALAVFSILAIYLILCLLWYFIIAIIMFAKYGSIRIALAGSHTVIINGSVYPVDCYSPILVFSRHVINGNEEIRFGEACLSSVPKYVAYRGIFSAEDFAYHSTTKAGNATIILFRTNRLSSSPI